MEQVIERAFAEMIRRYRIHAVLGISQSHVKALRYQVKHGIPTSLDKKIRLLRKSGWQPEFHKWTDADMVALLKFALKQGKAAKEIGPHYLFEKWCATFGKNRTT